MSFSAYYVIRKRCEESPRCFTTLRCVQHDKELSMTKN